MMLRNIDTELDRQHRSRLVREVEVSTEVTAQPRPPDRDLSQDRLPPSPPRDDGSSWMGHTVGEARHWLSEHIEDAGGVVCPTCTRLVRLYPRSLGATTAQTMILMYRHAETDWVYLPDLLKEAGTRQEDETKAKYWGLLEPRPGERDDGSTRTGWWRLTLKGVDFVEGRITVPKKAHIFNAQCFRFSGDQITIRDALGERFRYDELMGWVGT